MHDLFVVFQHRPSQSVSIDFCVEINLVNETLLLCKKIVLILKGNDFSLIPLGKCAFLGEFQIDAINSNFGHFESALYLKSVNMPWRCMYYFQKKKVVIILR